MSSEIRVNKINNRAGLGTVTYTDTGIIVSGIVTAYEFDGNFDTTPGIVVTGIATAQSLDVDDFVDVGSNIKLGNAGVVTATTFSGSGASLTSIANANISNSAAIAGSKISPNFGTQTLTAGLGYFTNNLNTTSNFSMTGGSTQINFNRASHSPNYRISLTGASNPTMNFRIKDTTNNLDRFIIRHGGNIEIPGDVGIGHPIDFNTTNVVKFSSYSTLHIKGPSSNGAAIRLQDNADTADSDDFVIYKNHVGGYLRVNGTDPLIAYMNGAERLRINSDGNLLLGTSTAAIGGGRGLMIANSAGARIKLCDSDAGVTANDGFEIIAGNGGTGYINNKENQAIVISTNNTERMRVTHEGSVGIGTNNSTYELEVVDATGASALRMKDGANNVICDLIANSTGGLLRTVYNHPLVFHTNQVERMRISNNGYVTKPAHPSFCARHQGSDGFSGDIIVLTRISTSWDVWNTGGHYSTSTGKFTAPVAGVYYFEGQVMSTGHSNGDNIQDMLSLESNNGRIAYCRQRESYFSSATNANGYYTNSVGSSTRLDAGDTVWIQRHSSQNWSYSNRYYSYFTGWLIG